MLWILEKNIYRELGHPLEEAALRAGHNVLLMDAETDIPLYINGPVLFHGSMNEARKMGPMWAYCDEKSHTHSHLKAQIPKLLLNPEVHETTVRKLVDKPEVAEFYSGGEEIFVRPVSPFKEFSGRVVSTKGLTAKDLDHGFYYDDLDLPIIVAPKKQILREWRFLVVEKRIQAWSGFEAKTRTKTIDKFHEGAFVLAEDVGYKLSMPDSVYMLDICETNEGFKVCETNPFSGSDLYDFKPERVIEFVERAVLRDFSL